MKGTKVQSKTQQEKAQEFLGEYQKLSETHGYRIVVTPAFQARDDGTWSVVLQTSVGRLPQKEKE